MLLPLSWLSDFLEDLPGAEVLSERLTMAGLEIEAISRPSEGLAKNLVVGRIAGLEKHPNADRLSLCRVDDGEGVRPVVCGARNMKAGDCVVLAKPGAVLPGGVKIKAAKLRGVRSEGMLCSAGELGLAGDEEGILVLPDDLEPGSPAFELLGLNETVLELSITPNRGDCLSIRGLAREIAAVCGLRLKPGFDCEPSFPPAEASFSVKIEDAAACPGYRGLELHGVEVKQSPLWLRNRLSAAGMRPINNVVDVTNYVLLELGQPLHAFDAGLLSGREISVRTAAETQAFVSLDESEFELLPGDIVICDAEGVVALGGVMGGARSAMNADTTSVFLEAAVFAPRAIRRTSRRLGLVTESSYRFERGVDGGGLDRALSRAAELICDLAGAEVKGAASGILPAEAAPSIRVRCGRVNAVLGIDISAGESRDILERLGLTVGAVCEDGNFTAVVPPHRHDLQREIDLIEEIARVKGYDRVPPSMPAVVMRQNSQLPGEGLGRRLRERLRNSGLHESIGFSFCSAGMNRLFPGLHRSDCDAVQLENPLRSDESYLRKSLLSSLFEAFRRNLHNGATNVDLFSLGRSFCGGDPPGEIDALAGLLWGPRRARGPGSAGAATFWDGKGVLERALLPELGAAQLEWTVCAERPEYHPRAAARLSVDGRHLGFLGAVHPLVSEHLEIPEEIVVFEVDTRVLLEYAPLERALESIPRFPASTRDVSLLVPSDMLAAEVIGQVEGLREELLEQVSVFDEYAGSGIPEGRKALAFSMVYRSGERTLTDDEVSELHGRVVAHLLSSLPVALRD